MLVATGFLVALKKQAMGMRRQADAKLPEMAWEDKKRKLHMLGKAKAEETTSEELCSLPIHRTDGHASLDLFLAWL